MRRLLLSLAVLGVSAEVGAQSVQKSAYGVFAKDVSDASYTYCRLDGVEGAFSTGIPGPGTIKTTGSTTTVDEGVTGSNVFSEVSVGDMLVFVLSNVTYRKAVTAKASAAQITVDTAVNIATPIVWQWYKQRCGTGTEDGWFPTGLFSTYQLGVDWRTKNATSLDHSFECRLAGSTPVVIEQASQTATGIAWAVLTAGVWDQCRAGLKLTGDTGAQVVDVRVGYKGGP